MPEKVVMMEEFRIDALYVRQSIDKKDSISIESQLDFCKYDGNISKIQCGICFIY